MGFRDDKKRFEEVGESRRQDLKDYITTGDLSSGKIKIPIKIVDLPSFEFDESKQGGIGQGDVEEGQQIGQPQPVPADGDGDEDGDEDGESGEAGEEEGDLAFYEMDPEEFAQELDEELDLNLEPKGKQVVEEIEGDFTDITRVGPNSTIDFDRMFKSGLRRLLSKSFDKEYLREVMRVDGMGPKRVHEWARQHNMPVSLSWIRSEYEDIDDKTRYESVDDIPRNLRVGNQVFDAREITFRKEDRRHKYPEIIKEREKNVVIVFIRDISGSMDKHKRELVERIFTPLDWYLTGKYDYAESLYYAHDVKATEVSRREFFGIKSSGGTKVSSAYEETKRRLEEEYPWDEWNRYIFAAGDSENRAKDNSEVIQLIKDIPANLHAYVETIPQGKKSNATLGDELRDEFENDTERNVVVQTLSNEKGVVPAIEEIINSEAN